MARPSGSSQLETCSHCYDICLHGLKKYRLNGACKGAQHPLRHYTYDQSLLQFRRRSSAESSVTFFEKALSGLSIQRSRSRSKSPSIIEQPEASDHTKGSLGLNLLYSPAEPLVDFVFVHGLGGGSRKTWSKTDNPYHYWPKEWLPKDPDFSSCRIYSFGYASDWNERRDRVLEINDFAASLLGEIKNDPGIRANEVRN